MTIIAYGGDRVFLSDEIGVKNLDVEGHHETSVAAAAKFGYWEEIIEGEPLPEGLDPADLEEARRYEAKALAERGLASDE